MASALPNYTIPQASPTRLPKLSYRTRSCDSDSVSSASTTFTRSTASIASTTPTSPLHSDSCLSPRSALSEMSLPPSPRQSTFAPSVKTTSSTLVKKRSNFLSNLFSAKEPSAQALQEYQRRLMKQGGGQVTPVGMSGVSSAKLPATVPKVNSKWDGVPQTVKEKEKKNNAGRPSVSSWTRQRGSSESGGSDHKLPSTADSSNRRLSRGTLGAVSMQSGSSNNLAELYGWESSSSHSGASIINFANEHRPSTSRSTPSRQRNPSISSHDLPRPPIIPPPPTERSSLSRIGSPNPPSLSNSPLLTPYESSPATPKTPPFLSTTSPKSESSAQDKAGTTLLQVPDFVDEVIVKSAGVNVLGPPAVAKRKPKPTPLQPVEQRPKTSGVEFRFSSIVRSEAPVSRDVPPPQPSLTSYFPNTIVRPISGPPASVPAKHNSSREELGLGMNMKSQIGTQSSVLQPDATSESERLIKTTPEGGKFLRKTRMALFNK